MTREQAVAIAQAAAKEKPEAYYTEPFQPHEWVVNAILKAGIEKPSFCFLFHQWKQWETTQQGKLKDQWQGAQVEIGFFELQRRECAHCKKSQIRWQQARRISS